jgi:hypothetical protein
VKLENVKDKELENLARKSIVQKYLIIVTLLIYPKLNSIITNFLIKSALQEKKS